MQCNEFWCQVLKLEQYITPTACGNARTTPEKKQEGWGAMFGRGRDWTLIQSSV